MATGVRITGKLSVPLNNAIKLKQTLAQFPVLIVVQATSVEFMHYESGVLDNPGCGNDPAHYMLLVGWGVDSRSGEEYWLSKNTWGTQWGEQGYIKTAILGDICGVTSYPRFI